jgi:hypothetical protein
MGDASCSIKVEDLFKKVPSLVLRWHGVPVYRFVAPRRWLTVFGRPLRRFPAGGLGQGMTAVNDFVELPTIEPNPPALRTIVDFDSLAFRDAEFHLTNGTIHDLPPADGLYSQSSQIDGKVRNPNVDCCTIRLQNGPCTGRWDPLSSGGPIHGPGN